MYPLDKATIRELAVRASVDPRSIQRMLAGEPVKGMAGHRARRVLQEAGLLPPGPEPSEYGQRVQDYLDATSRIDDPRTI